MTFPSWTLTAYLYHDPKTTSIFISVLRQAMQATCGAEVSWREEECTAANDTVDPVLRISGVGY